MKEIDEIIDTKAKLVNIYAEKKTEEIKKSVEQIENRYKNFQNDIEKTLLESKNTNEYSDYIKYLVSEDFESKQKEFIEQVEKTIIDSLPKKDNKLQLVYIAIGVIFVLQILLFIIK